MCLFDFLNEGGGGLVLIMRVIEFLSFLWGICLSGRWGKKEMRGERKKRKSLDVFVCLKQFALCFCTRQRTNFSWEKMSLFRSELVCWLFYAPIGQIMENDSLVFFGFSFGISQYLVCFLFIFLSQACFSCVHHGGTMEQNYWFLLLL